MFCIGDNTPEGSRHQGVEVVQEFSFMEVVAATNSFKTLLGEGSFGSVYYGRLLNGQEVAVKRSSPNSQQGFREFVNEVRCVT
jgi:predicted unusual protein kinase regulating ubiquinone biosynthesis (AarF/ABC1/UbiB family)